MKTKSFNTHELTRDSKGGNTMTTLAKKKKASVFDANKIAPIGMTFADTKPTNLHRGEPDVVHEGTPMRLSDSQWNTLSKLPELGRTYQVGRRPTDNRQVLDAVLWVMHNRARWQDLPFTIPSPRTCQRRLRRWQDDETWNRIWITYLSTLTREGRHEWGELFADVLLSGERDGDGDPLAEARIGRPPFWWSMAQEFWSDLGQTAENAQRDALIGRFMRTIDAGIADLRGSVSGHEAA